MIFITPYIIKNEQDGQDITMRMAGALESTRDEHGIEKKDMGGLIETKKPMSAPTGTVPAVQPAEAGRKESEPAPVEAPR